VRGGKGGRGEDSVHDARDLIHEAPSQIQTLPSPQFTPTCASEEPMSPPQCPHVPLLERGNRPVKDVVGSHPAPRSPSQQLCPCVLPMATQSVGTGPSVPRAPQVPVYNSRSAPSNFHFFSSSVVTVGPWDW
jgi:hypothetical protein